MDIAEYYTRRAVWSNKDQIRLVYARWVDKIRKFLVPGRILEVGSGSGMLRGFMPNAILSDVSNLPLLDRIVNCIDIPFGNDSLGGIVSIDTLHHIKRPDSFLGEVKRVLRPGGRVYFIEPCITFGSWFGYLFHHEKISFKNYSKDGNLAAANLVFRCSYPGLTVIHREIFSFFGFQGAGGFRPYSFIPHCIFRYLVKLDDWFSFLMPLIGYRIFVVLEKHNASNRREN